MHSLSSRGLLSCPPRSCLTPVLGRLTASAALVVLGGVVACSDNDDGGANTVALADSGSLDAITGTDIEIPTTVTVSQGVVWVVESQFSRFPAFVGEDAPPPEPFRLLGYPLSSGPREFIALPDNFFPEGITTARDGRIYVGSVATGAIYTVSAEDFDALPFVRSGELGGSVFGLTVSSDTPQSMIWACVRNEENVAWVAGIDIATASEVVRHELEPLSEDVPSFCNDVIQSPDGALWISESFGGRIFRVGPDDLMTENSATIWLEAERLAGLDGPADNIFGVNGLTLVGDRLYVVNSSRGSLWSIDPTLESPANGDLTLTTLSEDGQENVALYGPDGIYGLPNGRQLLIVENGFGLNAGKRVVMATLDTL